MRPSRPVKRFAATAKGTIAYLEAGEPTAPHVLLVHGIPTSSYLWRDVIPLLAGQFHCLAPDLMGLGDTDVDPRSTDFGMLSQAEMLDDFLDAVGAGNTHVVAHDQGGAAAQILAVNRTSRVRSLVLTDCVAYDNWPVPAIARLQLAARLAPRTVSLLCRAGFMTWWQQRSPRSSFRRGVSRPDRLPAESIAEYLRPLKGTARQRAAFLAFLLAGSPKPTLDIVPRLRELHTPTLILWAARDRFIPVTWARRLYQDIPGAVDLQVIDDAGHFWQEENPQPFAQAMTGFLTACEQQEPRTADRDTTAAPATAPGDCRRPQLVAARHLARPSAEVKA
jgi:2-hydroxymuconate-semialdehyde hydrolase